MSAVLATPRAQTHSTEPPRRLTLENGDCLARVKGGSMSECISVSEARYVGEYRIWLRFNTGESGEVDLRNLVFRFSAATPLREMSEFSRFYLDEWPTVAWTCGFDVDPEYLYTLATGKPNYETAVAPQTQGATT